MGVEAAPLRIQCAWGAQDGLADRLDVESRWVRAGQEARRWRGGARAALGEGGEVRRVTWSLGAYVGRDCGWRGSQWVRNCLFDRYGRRLQAVRAPEVWMNE